MKRVIRIISIVVVLCASMLMTNTSVAPKPRSVYAVTNGSGEPGFPRPILYGSLRSNGDPLINTSTGVLDQAAVVAMARFPIVILPLTPLADLHPELVTALRAENPAIKIYSYTLGHDTFCTPNYSANVYYRKYWEILEAFDLDADPFCNPADTVNGGGTGPGFLWWQNGAKGETDVNLAHRVADGQGGWTYDVATGLGTLMADMTISAGLDGIFIDVYCADIGWQETTQLKYDYQRAGYGSDNSDPANRAAFRAGWAAGHAALASAIRSKIPDPNYPVVGNCGQSPTGVRSTMNGWMQEGFPSQNGGTWFTNMYGYANPFGGFFADGYTYLPPQKNYIFTGTSYQSNTPDQWKSPAEQQRLRFGLASASLGNGYAAFEEYAAHAYTAPFHYWWADEYAVNRVTAHSSTSSQHTGWLGDPLSEAYQMIAPRTATKMVSNSEFETDTLGWSLTAYSGGVAQIQRSLEGGDYAASVTITQPGSTYYTVNLSTTTTFSISQNTPVTITFWAKANVQRPAQLVLYKPGVEYGSQAFSLSTTWKEYQFTILPSQTVADAQFRIDLGQASGVVTLDSIDIQTTEGNNLYRRDFEHGSVLLNPGRTTVTMNLASPMQKIFGLVNPTINTGDIVTSVTLTPNDAIFLLNADVTPPATINNLIAE